MRITHLRPRSMYESVALRSQSMIRSVSTLASNYGDIIIVVGVLVALALAVAIIGIVLHRRITSDRSNDHKHSPFDLHQLRQMHEDGQLTQAEFDRTVAALVAHQSAAAASPPANPDPTTPPQQPDSTSDTDTD